MRDSRGQVTYSSYRKAVKMDGRLLAAIKAQYLAVMGRPLGPSNCSQRHYDAVFEIERRLRDMKANPEMKITTAVLKNGVVIRDFATGGAYTNANLTDEVAIEYLKRFPSQANLFAVLPKVQAKKAKAKAGQ